jgi:hypothetical protein
MDIKILKAVAAQNIVLQVLTEGEEWRKAITEDNATVMIIDSQLSEINHSFKSCNYILATA